MLSASRFSTRDGASGGGSGKAGSSNALGESRGVAIRSDDDDLGNARLHGLEAGDELRAHAAAHGAGRQERPSGIRVELGHELPLCVEEAFDVREENEPLGAKSDRKRGSGGVGVDVEESALPPERDGRHDREEVGTQDGADELRVRERDPADESEVHAVDAGMEFGPQGLPVRAREARRRDAERAELGDERLVHEARQNRDDDVERLGIRDPEPAVRLFRNLERLQRRVDPLAAAVHDDDALPGGPARLDRGERALAERGVLEEAPAQLDDHGTPGMRRAHERPSVSGWPNTRFMFCTAWEAAPLSRLSMTETRTPRRPP